MAHTKSYTTKLENDGLYHIFNRSVGNELLFRSEENYKFFLRKYSLYLTDSVETIAFCLLPNHFHFFIRVVEADIASPNFKRLFQSYSLAYNRQQGRSGTLLERPFKRKEVFRNEHISRLIRYIHQNPQKHGNVSDFRDWKWSSFHEAYNPSKTRLTSNYIEDWFLSKEEFYSFHMEIESRGSLE